MANQRTDHGSKQKLAMRVQMRTIVGCQVVGVCKWRSDRVDVVGRSSVQIDIRDVKLLGHKYGRCDLIDEILDNLACGRVEAATSQGSCHDLSIV